jgi:hypothetical protein
MKTQMLVDPLKSSRALPFLNYKTGQREKTLLLVSENMFVEETYRPQSLTTVIIAVSV